jgi:hypothetical protein
MTAASGPFSAKTSRAEVWRRLSTSGSAWSYYRDNIEEEFTGRRGTVRPQGKSQQLDDLFKASNDDADA